MSSFAMNPANPQQVMFAEGLGGSSAVAHSSDGGTTWTQTSLPNLGLGGMNGSAYVAYDLTGKAYAIWADVGETSGSSNIAFSSSSDNGTTWSPAVTAVFGIDGIGESADSLVVDDNPASPFANSIYILSDSLNGLGNYGIQITVSSDGGLTWNYRGVSTRTYLRSAPNTKLAISKNGTLYATWDVPQSTSCGAVKVMVAQSKNAGINWSLPRTVMTVTQPPLCQLPNTNWALNLYPSVTVDNSAGANAGKVYVSAYNWTGTQMQVQVSSSSNGVNWSLPVRVAPGVANDEFNPWLNVSASGVLGVTWLDRRDDPANLKYRAYAALSVNGGKSFTKSLPIAAGLTDPGSGFPDTTLNLWDGMAFYALFPDTALTGTFQDVLGGIGWTE